MKIQCDVCNKEEASVFCSADEAALCNGCDHRVHHANKLASKHIRFSLLHPQFKESPRCDICQERRAFLFCQEDRAILCRECDIPIHKANEHTQKHNRYLLTGVKLSAPSSSSSRPASSSSNGCHVATESEIKSSISDQFSNPSPTGKALPSTSTPSISEYLMETLPVWQVDDFLDPSCSPHGFCKTYDHGLQFSDHDLERDLYTFASEDLNIWVPQAAIQSSHLSQCPPQNSVINALLKGSEEAQNVRKMCRKFTEDGFTVPQTRALLLKSRHLW